MRKRAQLTEKAIYSISFERKMRMGKRKSIVCLCFYF